MPTAYGIEIRATLHNIMPVTPIFSTIQGSLMLNRQTYSQNGTLNTEDVYSLTVIPTPPTYFVF